MKPLYTILLCLCSLLGFAQKHDYVWLSGYSSESGYIPNMGFYLGASVLDFNAHPVYVSYDSIAMNFSQTNASICDEDGNLLFYTNGIYIANGQHEKVEGSDSLNFSYVVSNYYPTMQQFGYLWFQAAIILPAYAPNEYYLLHSVFDTMPGGYPVNRRICYTLVDMSANNGKGKVVEKNVPIVEDNLTCEIAATKHANGSDWWIPIKKLESDCYYRILLDGSGPHVLPEMDCIENTPTYQELGSACFSPDGNKYIHTSHSTGVNIYDFDRCTGALSNRVNIDTSRFLFAISTSVSPNSRFLYLTTKTVLYQIDMQALDVSGSMDTIGVYDGHLAPYSTFIAHSQLAPDGRIYISGGNGSTTYHVVNNPDMPGVACNFVQHSLDIPSPSVCVPNFPNYRLGALPSGACDTLTSVKDIAAKEKILKVFPNPANDVITIDYGYTDWSKGEASMEIANSLGQVVHKQALPMYSGFQKLDVSNYASGSYTVFIKRKEVVVATGRLVRE